MTHKNEVVPPGAVVELNASGSATRKNLYVSVLRTVFPAMSRISPSVTCRLGLQLFSRPGRHPPAQWERDLLGSARHQSSSLSGRKIALYNWGHSDRHVLLCHGWGGRASQLGRFVGPLVESGYRVVALDAPAHGASAGARTNIVEYSDAIHAVIKEVGAPSGIVGHSFGAASSIFALSKHGLNVPRVAMVGCFSDARWVFDDFGQALNIPPRVVESMKSVSERRFGVSWAALQVGALARQLEGKILIVHDTQDREIPYAHAAAIKEQCGRDVTLTSTSGLGHRRILSDSGVIETVCRFVAS